MRAWALALLLVAPPLAGCVGGGGGDLDPARSQADPASASLEADPTAPGEHDIRRELFDFGYVVLEDPAPGQAYPARVNGSVHFPAEDEGPFPLVVVVHGRHSTCRLADDQQRVLATHVCPDAAPLVEPVDSWKGYRYLAETLASHGFVVASVNANDVNDRDIPSSDAGAQARAQMIHATLDGFEALDRGEDPYRPTPATATPARDTSLDDALEGRVDEDRIGLLGHSRGGEGVARAVTYDRQVHDGTHGIDAVFSLAPIDAVDVTPSGVDLAILLPYCDGDVFDLQGAHVFDRTRYTDRDPGVFKVQAVAMGANHNFYNSVWVDDFDDASGYEDPFCGAFRDEGGGRLTPEDQQRHGEALINAFFLESLTEGSAYADWLAGRAQAPASACPGGQAPCPELLHLTYQPPAGDRLVLEDALEQPAPDENELGGSIQAEGFANESVCEPERCPGWNIQGAPSLTLTWETTAEYALEVPPAYGDVAAYAALSLRVGVNHGHAANEGTAPDVSLRVTDADGDQATVPLTDHTDALFNPPGEDNAKVTLNQARVPLSAFAAGGVDLEQVREVSLVADPASSGSLQVNDVMLQR